MTLPDPSSTTNQVPRDRQERVAESSSGRRITASPFWRFGVLAFPQHRILAACGIVVAAAVLIAWPTRNGQFLSGDDERLILNHFLVNHPSAEHAWTLLTHVTDDLYQPLPMISFQFDYARAARELPGAQPPSAVVHVDRFPVDSAPFHHTNILLHALNAALAFLLARRLAGCSRVGFLAGLLFACHPFAVEPVAWINGRMILMATMFALALLLIVTNRLNESNAGTLACTLIVHVFSLLSKVLPTVPIVAAWCEYRVRGRLSGKRWLLYTLLLALSIAATSFAAMSTSNVVNMDTTFGESTTSVPARVLLSASYYMENYLWPTRLAAWSPPAQNVGLTSPRVLRALVECTAFAGLMVIARRKSATTFLGLGWFAILLSPFLIAGVTRRFLAADRYMYLPILGLHLAFASVFVGAVDRLRKPLGVWLAHALVGAPVLAGLVACITWSPRLSATWTDSVQRDQRVGDVYPDEPDVRAQLAKAHLFQGDADAALRVVSDARQRWPDNARLAAAAGEAYRAKKDWPAAERELRRALEKMPDHLRTNYLYALTLEELARRPEAMARYERLVKIGNDFLPAFTALARCYQADNRQDDAMRMFERALEINPNNVESLRRLAGILMSRKQDARALGLLQRAANIDPTDVTTMAWLHILLVESGRVVEAQHWWGRAFAAGLDTPEARSWWVWTYLLTCKDEAAFKLAAAIPDSSDPGIFASWALAVDAIMRDHEGFVGEFEEQGLFRQPFTTMRAERQRAIISTIAQLPSDKRNRPASLYLVARALLIDNNVAAARQVAEQIVATSPDCMGRQAAQRLLTEIATTQPSK